MQPRYELECDRHLINWPQGQDIPDSSIVRIVHARLVDTINHTEIQVPITIDRTNLNPDNTVTNNHITLRASYNHQLYTQRISIDLVNPATADYHQPQTVNKTEPVHQMFNPDAENESNNRVSKAPQPKPKSNHKGLKIFAIIVLIIALLFGIHSCNQAHQQNQAQQNQIGRLEHQNRNLQHQVNALQKDVNQYKQDQDNQKLQNQLANLKAQNNALKNSQNANDINKLNQAIDSIAANPDRASSYLNQIKPANSNNIADWWNNLTQQVQDWLNGDTNQQ